MSTLLLDACAGCAQAVKCGCVLANATNRQDVEIVKTICCSIVTLAAIIVGGFLIWKLMDHIANGISGCYKRKYTLEDIERKMKAHQEMKG
jgi:hypothetical protein